MKVSEQWLRQWVDPAISTTELAEQLTMAGLEVGSVEPAAAVFTGVVVGKVLRCRQHPDADKLRVCEVDTGAGEARQIVCGAANVVAGQWVAVAEVGAQLPGDVRIRKTKLRGVESSGMICSASELGLSDDSSGIMVLPESGQPGQSLRDLLWLDDQLLDLELTPNRGDCLSVYGVAREVSVLNRVPLQAPPVQTISATIDAALPIRLEDPRGCPIYAGRVVRGIDSSATTPLWMQERLRRSGLRPIHPVVDVTNYVMLECGQPMHAFDLRQLHGGIVVRRAAPGETLTLLDGRELELDPEVLMIADQQRAKAVAGIMGGEESGVSDDTTDLFFESAYFDPLVIAGRARRFGLHTDASHRYERGVEPGLQERALERATELILEIAGGQAGPVTIATEQAEIPQRQPVALRRRQLARLLGHTVPDRDVERILGGLQMQLESTPEGWQATPPAFRFDIQIEADLIEEVARIYGFNRLPETDARETYPLAAQPEVVVPLERVKDMLVARGFREVVTYSFVDPVLHRSVLGEVEPLALANPISSELSVMRMSLLPGLLETLRLNLSRQQERALLFESGLRFIPQGDDLKQEKVISGLLYGSREPEQWGRPGDAADFYDLKADVEAVLQLSGIGFAFEAAENPVFHPGQSAAIRRSDGTRVGWIGALHPARQARLDLPKPAYLFEILARAAFHAKIPVFATLSRFPSLRRDISFLVDEEVSAAQIVACIREHAPETLRDVRIFDIYRDSSIDSGRKSVALGLILQDYCSTLTDGDADAAVAGVRAALVGKLGAKIRD